AFMSSGGMYGAALHADDPEYRQGRFSGITAYARAKRMQVTLAQMWADRLASQQVEAYSMHPGWVDTPGVADSLPRFRTITRPLLCTVHQGADTMIWLVATQPDGSGTQRFWHDRREQRRALWDYL